jgi:subtilisin family serine protease
MDKAETDVSPAMRVHEVRIGVEICGDTGFPDLAELLDASLADWQADPLLADDSDLWLISGYVAERVGTAPYARLAHSLVQAILHTGTVRRAEADIPVTAFVGADSDRGVPSLGAPAFPPGSEASRWARDAIRCEEAWAIEPTRGEGILIGHPDTGYTLHPNVGAGAFDLGKDRDFISNDDDALDPLIAPDDSPWPMPFPGHGTTTASVMVGRGSEEAGIVGVAPGSKVVPLRAVESVVQLFDSDVARAVDHARFAGCHVVSISVGGKGFFGLRTAIQKAVDSGMIVMAAAGNNVGIVVAPASYPNCLAVAATGPDDSPWPESSRGRAVDVSAPGWGVHVAGYVWEDGAPDARVLRSAGTSYAATHLAGVAALWLAHHGPAELRRRYGPGLQAVFLHQLRTGGSRVPAGWDAAAFGAGIVDAAAMLVAPLPAAEELMSDIGRSTVESPFARLSALVSVGEMDLEAALAAWMSSSGEELNEVVKRFEGELAFHFLEYPDFRAAVLGEVRSERPHLESLNGSSSEFRSAFGGAERHQQTSWGSRAENPDPLSRA